MTLHISRCDQCGQADDHPKVHAEPQGTFHHDCLSADLRQQVIDSAPLGQAVIEACEGGLRGDALRDHIVNVIHQGA
jgi:hypothetical protein